MPQKSLEGIVAGLDVLIRARYPLIAVNTPEEGRFHRIIRAVAQLKCHKEKEKGLFIWSRIMGLRQVLGPELKGKDEALIPDTQDAMGVLEHIAQQKKGLFVLCDYGPYLTPYAQEEPQLVRRLRELAWEIKGRHINVIFVERNFPDISALEKEIKIVDLPLPDEQEVIGKSLLDLDFGSVMGEGGGVLGTAARGDKRALSIATTLRGILGISEFEKAVGGLESSSRTDGGETARTIAYLLNWMQEQSDVFVIGTANDVRGLAAEQTRQGRFSHIVFVDLPTLDDRREIFAVHLRKRNREPEEFDLDELAEVTEGYSGAEIEAAVKAGLLRAFMDGERWLMTEDIVECAGRIQPTSVIKREQVESLRNWAKDHMAVDAGGVGVTPIGERMNGARALEM